MNLTKKKNDESQKNKNDEFNGSLIFNELTKDHYLMFKRSLMDVCATQHN